jgi:periplasmic divalent cation tolerance protein
MDDREFIVILSTCGSRDEAERIAEALVTECTAACVNIIDRVTSIYRWHGKVEKGTEALLVIKTRATLAGQVEKTIKAMSSYDCPEVVVLPIVTGSAQYLGWIDEATPP